MKKTAAEMIDEVLALADKYEGEPNAVQASLFKTIKERLREWKNQSGEYPDENPDKPSG